MRRKLIYLITAGLVALVIWACAGVAGDPCPTPGATKKLDDGHTYTCQQNQHGKRTWGGY